MIGYQMKKFVSTFASLGDDWLPNEEICFFASLGDDWLPNEEICFYVCITR